MILVTNALRARLRANDRAHCTALAAGRGEPDPAPVVKFFNPLGAGTWLASELQDDGDTLFGLADLGFGCPELGCFSLGELVRIRLPFGLRIERDIAFSTALPLSLWAETARRCGSILEAQRLLWRGQGAPPSDLSPSELPQGPKDGADG